MKDMEKMLPPSPGDIADAALGIVENVSDRAQEISKFDPVNVGAGLIGDAARDIRGKL